MNFPSIKDIYSGTYTPTVSNLVNLDADPTFPPFGLYYTKIGNLVRVRGRIGMNPTAVDTLTQVELSLPFPSELDDSSRLTGSITAFIDTTDTANMSGVVIGTASNKTALINITVPSATNKFYTLDFEYEIL